MIGVGRNPAGCFMMLHHRHGNDLDGNDEAHHGDGVDCGVCHAGDVAVHHGVGGGKTGSGGHATGDSAKKVEHGNLEDQSAYQSGYEHGNQCECSADAEEQQAACLECGYECLSCGCTYLGKEKQQAQLAQKLVRGT